MKERSKFTTSVFAVLNAGNSAPTYRTESFVINVVTVLMDRLSLCFATIKAVLMVTTLTIDDSASMPSRPLDARKAGSSRSFVRNSSVNVKRGFTSFKDPCTTLQRFAPEV